MAQTIPIGRNWLNNLLATPNFTNSGQFGQSQYCANILIPQYKNTIETVFKDTINGSLQTECDKIDMACNFTHFGLVIKFSKPTEIKLYDENLHLDQGLCEIISDVGPVIFKNAYFESSIRDDGHRNRFPNFQFHIDRSAKQETRYSLYTRNPFDDEQKYPRTSSTLFIANIAAYLQGLKQLSIQRGSFEAPLTSIQLFDKTPIDEFIGKIVLEQPWDEPLETGEIAVIDNATVLHASYYRDAARSGYKIGVRYLAGL